MPTLRHFKLDECVNNEELSRKCNAAKQCVVHRYNKALRGKKDEEMLPILLSENSTLLTTDRKIIADHSDCIPEANSGAIVIKTIDPTRPLTIKTINKIIDAFKSRFSLWPLMDYSNVYLEIDEVGISVSKLHKHTFANSIYFYINDQDLARKLSSAVNALRDGRP
jgi:hypothetical protein